jgi:hypothetical protein
MKNMKDMKGPGEKMNRMFQTHKDMGIIIIESDFISPLSSSQSGLLHGLHALHGEIQISQQRVTDTLKCGGIKLNY